MLPGRGHKALLARLCCWFSALLHLGSLGLHRLAVGQAVHSSITSMKMRNDHLLTCCTSVRRRQLEEMVDTLILRGCTMPFLL